MDESEKTNTSTNDQRATLPKEKRKNEKRSPKMGCVSWQKLPNWRRSIRWGSVGETCCDLFISQDTKDKDQASQIIKLPDVLDLRFLPKASLIITPIEANLTLCGFDICQEAHEDLLSDLAIKLQN